VELGLDLERPRSLDNTRATNTTSKTLGALSDDTGTANVFSKALGALCDAGTANVFSKALGALAVADRHIRRT